MSKLDGSIMNLKSAIGRAIDNNGEQGIFTVTHAAEELAHFTQILAEADPKILAFGTAAAGVVSMFGAVKLAGWFTGASALKGSAVALDEAAAHLMMVGGGPGNPLSKVPPVVPPAAVPGLAIPGAVTLGAGLAFLGGAAAGAYVIKKSMEAQQPGMGGLWAPATIATESADRGDVIEMQAERERLATEVARQRALEKIPGTADAATSAQRDRIAQLDAAIDNKQRSLDALHPNAQPVVVPMPAPRPGEMFGPNLPAFHPDDDRMSRSRASDADPYFREMQEKEQQQIFQLGALSDKSGVVLASFTTLDGGTGALNTTFGALGTGVGSASHELDVLALAARTTSTAFASLLQAAAAGGGNGIIKASFGGGGGAGGGWNGNPLAVAGGFGSAGWTKSGSTRPEVASYIKAQAARLGIDPNVALRVAQSEGLNTYVGDYGTSFGAFQLHYGGSGIRGMNSGGLGDRFTRETGLNARDPSTWKAQVEYALRTAKREGWGAWHGARHVGIGDRQGLDWHGQVPQEHPALAAPALPRKGGSPHDAPAHLTIARLEEKMERMAKAVERGGLHRIEIKPHRTLVAQKTYSRGDPGMTTG